MLKAGLPSLSQEQRLQFYQRLNRCGSFSLLSAPHSLFSIWTDLKRSEMIPGAPTLRWGEWIRLTGPSGLHRNSRQGLNISFMRVFFFPEQRSRNPNHPSPHVYIYNQIVLPKGRFFTQTSGSKTAVLLGMNRWGSFPLLSAIYIIGVFCPRADPLLQAQEQRFQFY